MAVGPACHRCGNRASLGPGTIRISDMFQFRFFVHLRVFLLASFFTRSHSHFLHPLFARLSTNLSFLSHSFPFICSVPFLYSLLHSLPFDHSFQARFLSRSRSFYRLFSFYVSRVTIYNRKYNRKGVLTLLSTFPPSPTPSPSLFLSFSTTFIRLYTSCLRYCLKLLEYSDPFRFSLDFDTRTQKFSISKSLETEQATSGR